MCLCNTFCVSFVRSFVRSTLILFECYTLLNGVCIRIYCDGIYMVLCECMCMRAYLIVLSEATKQYTETFYICITSSQSSEFCSLYSIFSRTHTLIHIDISPSSALVFFYLCEYFFQFECSFHALMYVCACVTLACIGVFQFGQIDVIRFPRRSLTPSHRHVRGSFRTIEQQHTKAFDRCSLSHDVSRIQSSIENVGRTRERERERKKMKAN